MTMSRRLGLYAVLLVGLSAVPALGAEAGPAPAAASFTAKGDRHPAVNTVWCRQVNTEHFLSNFAFRNSTAWILGFKTEAHGNARSFSAVDGTRLEALGGLFPQPGVQTVSPLFAEDSTLCVSMMAPGNPSPEALVLEGVRNGKAKGIPIGVCPPLNASKDMAFIPLPTNY